MRDKKVVVSLCVFRAPPMQDLGGKSVIWRPTKLPEYWDDTMFFVVTDSDLI
jgi:hypothetical protein